MIRNARNYLEALSIRQLRRMLRATELSVGSDSDGARILRRTIVLKKATSRVAAQEMSKDRTYISA
jgi:hypothetical protein